MHEAKINPDDCRLIIWDPAQEAEPGRCPKCGAASKEAVRFRGDKWKQHAD